jgi:hypothetical protein
VEKLKALLAEYGNIALGTYIVIWLATMAGFAIAISMGVKVESAASGAGLLGASWVAAKLTQPIRIAATIAATPLVHAALRKLRGRPSAAPQQSSSTE